jgi:DNA primase
VEDDSLKLLKEQCYVDERVPEILQLLGCGHIHDGRLITASLPDGNNRKSIQIKNTPTLITNIRSRGVPATDLYGLVGYILYGCQDFEELKPHLNDCKNWICDNLSYPEFKTHGKNKMKDQSDENFDFNAWLRPFQEKRQKEEKKKEQIIVPNKVKKESILWEFYKNKKPIVNQWWLDDNILPYTQIQFECGYDLLTKRITFPIRDENGGLVGVKGRTTTSDDVKYLFLYKCNKSILLFNLHRAKQHILEKKEVLIFESEKSCMLATQYGFPHCISMMGSDISPYQVELIKKLGDDIRIVICYDNDKKLNDTKDDQGKTIDTGIRTITKVFGDRQLHVMYDWKKDEDNLLQGKQAPVDVGKETFVKLYNERIYRLTQSTK